MTAVATALSFAPTHTPRPSRQHVHLDDARITIAPRPTWAGDFWLLSPLPAAVTRAALLAINHFTFSFPTNSPHKKVASVCVRGALGESGFFLILSHHIKSHVGVHAVSTASGSTGTRDDANPLVVREFG